MLIYAEESPAKVSSVCEQSHGFLHTALIFACSRLHVIVYFVTGRLEDYLLSQPKPIEDETYSREIPGKL